ncbi:MAG: hypothetical protein HY921_07040 [Elusimicrobia bacterium]|nr:hypothetical protein [Elusimicrobiota bacterium]
MRARTILFAAILAAPSSGLGQTFLPERHFQDGWSKAPIGGAIPAPEVRPAPVLGSDGGPIHDEHDMIAHMHMTLKAYEMYASQYDGGELGRYIGGIKDGKPSDVGHGTVVAGAYEEDVPFLNPFGELIPVLRHFWDCRKGPYEGIVGSDSSVDRAQKYFTGGYGLDGGYDESWSENLGEDEFKGERGLGAVALYRKGDKAKAYWYLGHAAHLLEDLTVPAHALLWPHVVPGMDSYEFHIKTRYPRWDKVPADPIEAFDSLYELFYKTGLVTVGFDAGFAGGLTSGIDGTADKGRRRAGGFTESELDEEGDILVPLLYKRVAALFLRFYREVDRTPPVVRLAVGMAASGTVELSTAAEDEESGVNKAGYRFFYSCVEGGSWSAWREVPGGSTGPQARFKAPHGALCAVKVQAMDAAGNSGESSPSYLTGLGRSRH